jgi:hypothetical protein
MNADQFGIPLFGKHFLQRKLKVDACCGRKSAASGDEVMQRLVSEVALQLSLH